MTEQGFWGRSEGLGWRGDKTPGFLLGGQQSLSVELAQPHGKQAVEPRVTPR